MIPSFEAENHFFHRNGNQKLKFVSSYVEKQEYLRHF